MKAASSWITTAPGTSLDESGRQVGQIDQLLRANPEVLTFSRRLGTGLGGDLGQSYHGDYFVRLKPNHSRPTEDVAAAVADEIGVKVPGVQVEVAQLIEDLIGDLTAVPQPIEVKLYSSDPTVLDGQAKKVAALIEGSMASSR
jgi:Cu/Ag efflux pump CusA